MVAFESALAKSCPSENHALYVCHISLANSIPCFSVIATFSRKEGIRDFERGRESRSTAQIGVPPLATFVSAAQHRTIYQLQVAEPFFSRQKNKIIPTSIIIHTQLGCSFQDNNNESTLWIPKRI